jgi:uncharacterized protein YegP (UPF0339 family)
MGKFSTKTGKDGQHYFNLLATNGQVILSSEGYTTTAAMHNGIESVKRMPRMINITTGRIQKTANTILTLRLQTARL